MANRVIRYTLVGASVEREPHDALGRATIRALVKTKAGNFHTLLVSMDAHNAIRLRSVLTGLCQMFKREVAALWNRL